MALPKWLWPAVDDFEESRKAAGLGAGTAFLVGSVTGVIAFLHQTGHTVIAGIDSSAYIDAVIFLVLGFLITRMSRLAAVFGLCFYVWGQFEMAKMMAAQGEHLRLVIPILFSINFVNGVRGTMTFHEMKKRGASEEEEKALKLSEQDPEVVEAEKAKRRKVQIAALTVLILTVAAVAGMAAYANIKNGKLPVQKTVQAKNEKQAVAADEGAARPGELTFHLKSGETIRGKVVHQDDIYYAVETWNGEQKTVFKEDLDPSRPPA